MAIGVMTLDEMSELRSASVMMWICHIDDFTYKKITITQTLLASPQAT